MDISQQGITLHPHWLNQLFAYQSKTRAVFSDVLGIHEINHIALAYLSSTHTLHALSSTPSMEYNLFSSGLWRFDRSYDLNWFSQCTSASWQSLYTPERFDELYYIKQAKPNYPLGLSIAAKTANGYIVYAIASATNTEYTQAIFSHQQHELIQIGQYCSTQLLPLLIDTQPSSHFQPLITGTL